MWKTNRTTTIILTIDNDYPLYYGDVEIDVLAHPAEPRTTAGIILVSGPNAELRIGPPFFSDRHDVGF